VKVTRRSTLSEVAACVATALAESGIRCVLTGGACATLYTRGVYQSSDLDFVIQSAATRSQLDAAMRKIGFGRRGDQYANPATQFFVEFPPGPLAIGGDFRIQPVEYAIRRRTVLALSATDSCRDRLAAFYFWSDRQSLRTAVQIAGRQGVDLGRIREWSIEEGHQAGFEEFLHELALARRRRGQR
jgi:hypothetical protein